MVLFGKEFDADDGTEVGGGLRGGEGVESNVSVNKAFDVHGVPENLLIEQVKLRVETDGCHFVFIHQKLRVLTLRRPMYASGWLAVEAVDSISAKTVALDAVAAVGAAVVEATCTPLR